MSVPLWIPLHIVHGEPMSYADNKHLTAAPKEVSDTYHYASSNVQKIGLTIIFLKAWMQLKVAVVLNPNIIKL